MLAASPVLKVFYPHLIHLIHLAHGRNRLAEQIRNEFPEVNSLISNMKKVFCKMLSRTVTFKEILLTTLLPAQPVLSCWCTWLKAVEYYSKNLEAIEEIAQALPDTDAACVPLVRGIVKDVNVKRDTSYIRSNFAFLIVAVTKLEASEIPLYDLVAAVENVQEQLRTTPESSVKVRRKWKCIVAEPWIPLNESIVKNSGR
jgi:hypothetical protein